MLFTLSLLLHVFLSYSSPSFAALVRFLYLSLAACSTFLTILFTHTHIVPSSTLLFRSLEGSSEKWRKQNIWFFFVSFPARCTLFKHSYCYLLPSSPCIPLHTVSGSTLFIHVTVSSLLMQFPQWLFFQCLFSSTKYSSLSLFTSSLLSSPTTFFLIPVSYYRPPVPLRYTFFPCRSSFSSIVHRFLLFFFLLTYYFLFHITFQSSYLNSFAFLIFDAQVISLLTLQFTILPHILSLTFLSTLFFFLFLFWLFHEVTVFLLVMCECTFLSKTHFTLFIPSLPPPPLLSISLSSSTLMSSSRVLPNIPPCCVNAEI